jgi:hypothetical protein
MKRCELRQVTNVTEFSHRSSLQDAMPSYLRAKRTDTAAKTAE